MLLIFLLARWIWQAAGACSPRASDCNVLALGLPIATYDGSVRVSDVRAESIGPEGYLYLSELRFPRDRMRYGGRSQRVLMSANHVQAVVLVNFFFRFSNHSNVVPFRRRSGVPDAG